MRALGFEPRKDEVKRMVEDIDKDGTGQIEYGEFLAVILRQSEVDLVCDPRDRYTFGFDRTQKMTTCRLCRRLTHR